MKNTATASDELRKWKRKAQFWKTGTIVLIFIGITEIITFRLF